MRETCESSKPSEAPLALDIVSPAMQVTPLKPHKLENEVDKNRGPDSKRQYVKSHAVFVFGVLRSIYSLKVNS